MRLYWEDNTYKDYSYGTILRGIQKDGIRPTYIAFSQAELHWFNLDEPVNRRYRKMLFDVLKKTTGVGSTSSALW